MKPAVAFDFDGCLVDTSELAPYRRTYAGRSFVASHPANVPSYDIDEDLVHLVNDLNVAQRAYIWTNAATDYTQALLEKHGFDLSIPIFGAVNKPNTGHFHSIRRRHNHILVVGDSPLDILTGHLEECPSIAVTWGFFDADKLQRSEPTHIAETAHDLCTLVDKFMCNTLEYNPRQIPDSYQFTSTIPRVGIPTQALGTYVPTTHGGPTPAFTHQILRVKEAKEVTEEKIKEGARSTFFYNGSVRRGDMYRPIIETMAERVADIIPDDATVMAVPNSFPVYCYQSDVNQMIVNRASGDSSAAIDRIVERVFPRIPAHLHGHRALQEHIRTIGFRGELPDTDTIVLFDDVTTSGSQLNSVAHILREQGFGGQILGIVLGATD